MGGVSDEIKLSTRGVMAQPVLQHPLSRMRGRSGTSAWLPRASSWLLPWPPLLNSGRGWAGDATMVADQTVSALMC